MYTYDTDQHFLRFICVISIYPDCLTFELTVQTGVKQVSCSSGNSAYEQTYAGSESFCVLKAFEEYLGIIMHTHVPSAGHCRMCYNCGTTCSTTSQSGNNVYTKICGNSSKYTY